MKSTTLVQTKGIQTNKSIATIRMKRVKNKQCKNLTLDLKQSKNPIRTMNKKIHHQLDIDLKDQSNHRKAEQEIRSSMISSHRGAIYNRVTVKKLNLTRRYRKSQKRLNKQRIMRANKVIKRCKMTIKKKKKMKSQLTKIKSSRIVYKVVSQI